MIQDHRWRVVPALALGLTLAISPPVRAAKRLSLADHGLRFLGLDAAEERALRLQVGEALRQAPGLSLTHTDPVAVSACLRDIHCHCRLARERGAARALFGNIGRMGQIYTFEIVLVEAQGCAIENSVFVSETHDADSAAQRLAALLTRLTTPRESVSETAAKDVRDIDAAAAIVSVFTAKQMQELGIQRFEELLRLVPGFEALDANWGSLVLHHGLPGTILLLVDGVPLTNPMQNFLYYSRNFQVSLNPIDRVEFVRGPGSVLWGPNAFLGMINIITRQATDTTPRFTAKASYGTLNTIDLFTSAEQRHRYFAYYLAATVNLARGPQVFVESSPLNPLSEDPPYDIDLTNKSGMTQNRFDNFYNIVGKLEILRRLQFMIHYSNATDYFQISPYGALLSPETSGFWHHEQRLYGLAWEDSLRFGFRYRLSASRYEYRDWENYAMHPPDPRGDPEGLRYLQGNEVEPQVTHLGEARVYHTYEGRRWMSQLLLGALYRHQLLPDIYATVVPVTAEPGFLDLDLETQQFHTIAGYLQEEISLFKWFLLSGGVSLEHRIRPGKTETVLSNQGAFIFRAPFFNAKVIYAEGFRPPEANSLYSRVGLKGNPDLQSERSRALSFEAGTTWGPLRFRAGATTAWLSQLVLVQQNKDVHCSEDKNIIQCVENAGSTNVTAGYGEVRLEWPPLLTTFVNYSYKRVRESDPIGKGIALAPHTASLGLSLRPMNDLDIFGTASFLSRRTVQAYPWNPPEVDHLIPETFDFTIGAWLTNIYKGLDVGLTLHNPFGLPHYTPYDVDGNTARFIERRKVSEVFLTLRWSSALELPEVSAGNRPPPTPSASVPAPPPPAPLPAPASAPAPAGVP